MAKKLICYPFHTTEDGTESMLEYVHINLDDRSREACYRDGRLITKEYTRNVLWYPQQQRRLKLTYLSYGRGRSSVTFYWKDQDGNTYPMFLKDVDYMLRNNKAGKNIEGDFEFVKRGANYGIKLCE